MLMPIAIKLGIDPTHFGIIVSLNLSIGLATPPYGICLFVACTIARRSVSQVAAKIWAPLIPLVIVLFIVTYYPPVVLGLPNALITK